jgi:hypothetical protein
MGAPSVVMMPPSPPPEPLDAAPELLLLVCDEPLLDPVPPPLEEPPAPTVPLELPELDPVWLPPSSEVSFDGLLSVPSELPVLEALLHPYPTALVSTHIPT